MIDRRKAKGIGNLSLDKRKLDIIYARYNHEHLRASDPVNFVYRYSDPLDREVAALIASTLAFGNIAQILRSVESALNRVGDSPSHFLMESSHRTLRATFEGFKHRWISGDDLASLLYGFGRVAASNGSLGRFFSSCIEGGEKDIAQASCRLVRALRDAGGNFRPCLLPSPKDSSACKRLFLFLRWMVRCDEIDTGLWSYVPASMLLVPLDIHMYRIARRLGMTKRATANLATVREITDSFRELSPEDPVKYDFALVHYSIDRAKEARKI